MKISAILSRRAAPAAQQRPLPYLRPRLSSCLPLVGQWRHAASLAAMLRRSFSSSGWGWVFEKTGPPMRKEEFPLPVSGAKGGAGEAMELKAGEVVVEMTLATVCGSDLHTVTSCVVCTAVCVFLFPCHQPRLDSSLTAFACFSLLKRSLESGWRTCH